MGGSSIFKYLGYSSWQKTVPTFSHMINPPDIYILSPYIRRNTSVEKQLDEVLNPKLNKRDILKHHSRHSGSLRTVLE